MFSFDCAPSWCVRFSTAITGQIGAHSIARNLGDLRGLGAWIEIVLGSSAIYMASNGSDTLVTQADVNQAADLL